MRRSQRPLLNKFLGLVPLEIGQAKFVALEDALDVMGTDFSPEQLAAALDAQTHVVISVGTLYRWKRETVS